MVRLLIGAALLAACTDSGSGSGTFDIRLALDMRAGSFCTSTSCEDYEMSCGARLAIHIDDLERGAPAVAPQCIDVAPADSLCGLENINPTTFYGIPPNRVRISVAVWGHGVLPDGLCPTEDIFDERGVPRADFMPQPAFGGAEYFDVGGEADQVVVPLSCTDVPQLDGEECTGAETTRVLAEVEDIATVLDVTPEQAAELDVSVAAPRQIPGLPASEYVIDGKDTIDLAREDGPVPTFATEIDEELGDTLCTVVFDRSAAESTASAVCRDLFGDQDPLEVPGVLVGKDTLDAILDAMVLEDFPRQGLVIGRVVDHAGVPLAGVSVTPDGVVEPDAVKYLSADLSGVGGTETSASGFFASTIAPFGTRWIAVHNVDGRREEGESHAGLVRDKVSALIIEMQQP
jgi:hypothetical protein